MTQRPGRARLQNEIGVSRLGQGEIGYFAGDPEQRITTLEQIPDAANEGRNGENFRGKCVETRASPVPGHVPIVTYPQRALRRCSPPMSDSDNAENMPATL